MTFSGAFCRFLHLLSRLNFCFVILEISYGRCFTPDEYRGSCIKFPECQPLFELAQKKPPSDRDRTFISLSQCGFRDGKPLVCCRDQQTVQPTQPSHVTQPSVTAPPIQSQANPHLPLPGVCGEDSESKIYGGNRVS